MDKDGGGELQISINRKDLEGYVTGGDGEPLTLWKDLNSQQLANELLTMRIELFDIYLKAEERELFMLVKIIK
ncbi:MAG: hypothetical protein mread185_000632 [Mycoplasmataceae bacterium]|nr:MAG: hypothetical protein mread185_000632 [Mycoplasmataceae bacterium]